MKIIGPDNRLLSIVEWAELQPTETGDHIMITRVRIRDFRSIEALDVQVPPGGLEVKGRNGLGKTNFARAIRAALTGIGVSPDAIRDGATSSEVLVDTDDPKLFQIRQTITANGGSCTVKNRDGDKLARPRERLKETFGLSSFDPLAFYLAKPADQRRMLLEAMPVTVTAEDVQRWTGDVVPLNLDVNRNGLEVLSALHRWYYDLRKSINKDVDMSEDEHRRALDKFESLDKPEHKGVAVPPVGEEDAPVRAAEKAAEALAQRKQQADDQAKRAEGILARIAQLRERASELMAKPEAVAPMSDAVELVESELRKADQELKEAQRRFDSAKTARDLVVDLVSKSALIASEAKKYNDQAADLEASIAATSIEPPTTEEFAAAASAITAARARAELVRYARAAHDAHMTAMEFDKDVRLAKEEAERLDRIVKTLQVDAPTELAARGNLVPGLTVTEDGVLYQGRPTDDSMSGAQRMLVAVQIARMVNPKAGLLVVDEIGVLDEEHMREFVRLCTADGWQLIATKMENLKDAAGNSVREMVLEAIEVDQKGGAA